MKLRIHSIFIHFYQHFVTNFLPCCLLLGNGFSNMICLGTIADNLLQCLLHFPPVYAMLYSLLFRLVYYYPYTYSEQSHLHFLCLLILTGYVKCHHLCHVLNFYTFRCDSTWISFHFTSLHFTSLRLNHYFAIELILFII